jgi:hypothetical protein
MTLVLSVLLAVLGGSCGKPEVTEAPVEIDDWPSDTEILAMVLKRSYEDGGFTVVEAETSASFLSPQDPEYAEEARETREYVLAELEQMGLEEKALLDEFVRRNAEPVRLNLESSTEDGYLVDYEGKYDAYFEDDGGGWEKWYEENPNAHGSTTVSLPVFDEESGVILIYIGSQTHWLAGIGYLVAYRYEDGNLREIGRVELWMS